MSQPEDIKINVEKATEKLQDVLSLIIVEYYVAAEPPVRCGESHHSGQTEPPCCSLLYHILVYTIDLPHGDVL